MSSEEGRYIYCIIGDSEEKKFTFPAIGSGKDEACPVRNIPEAGQDSNPVREESSNGMSGVYSISYQDIAAVISSSPIMKYSISQNVIRSGQVILDKVIRHQC